MFSLFRSLRWRLQSWHAIMLLLVVVVFGSLLHFEMVRAHWDRVDDELLAAARILEGTMNAVPQSILQAMAKDVSSRQGPRRRPPNANKPRREPLGQTAFGPPEVAPPKSGPLKAWNFSEILGVPNMEWTEEEWEASIELPPQLPEQLGRAEGPAYFMIWRADGTVMKESKVPPQNPEPNSMVIEAIDRDRYGRQQRGPFREVFIRGPHETIICVGRPVMGERAVVGRLTWTIVLGGLSVLGLGLVGGWWFSKQAIASIERMSQTAQRISGNSLSERIAVSGFDTELAGLGTSLNTMLDRLAQSFEQQRQFTADASHEIRTPLSVILTSSELALSKPRTAEEYRDQLLKCQRAAARMRDLGDSMLTLARMDANPAIEKQSLDVSKLVEEAVESIRPLADERSLHIEMSLQPCPLQGNPSLLRQAIDNILSNAIKYNQPNGRVSIRCMTVDRNVTIENSVIEKVVIEIEDTGIGIPESAIPKLFDRFFRVDESRSRSVGGTGLGLSIANQIVLAHGGMIEVQSAVGTGSTFRILLPI